MAKKAKREKAKRGQRPAARDLHALARRGDAAALRAALGARGAAAVAHRGVPLLHAAVAGGRTAVEAALAAGAPVDARDAKRGETALGRACRTRAVLAVVHALLDAGADVDLAAADGTAPLAAARAARDAKACHALVTAKADVRIMYAEPDAVAGIGSWNGEASDASSELSGADDVVLTDSFGFVASDGHDAAPRKVNSAHRQAKWTGMVHSFDAKGRWPRKFASRLRKGVPVGWRGGVWCRLLGVPLLSPLADDQKERSAAQKEYERHLAVPMPASGEQIDMDVMRESRAHVLFRERYGAGQRQLFRVLWATAAKDAELGYVQGMSGIAALLLLFSDELSAFLMLQRLLDTHGMRDAFLRGFPLLEELCTLHDSLAARHVPAVRDKLDKNGIVPQVYCTEWFLKCFYQRLPLSVALHVFDLFVADGYAAVLDAALATLRAFEPQLVNEEIEQIMKLLQDAAADTGNAALDYDTFHATLDAAHKTVRKELPGLLDALAAQKKEKPLFKLMKARS